MATATKSLPAPPVVQPALERRNKPVKFWAGLGTVFLVLQVYIYVAWVFGGKPTRTPAGVTPLPSAMRIVLATWQAASPVFMVVFFYFVLVRPWRRNGRITLDGLFCLVFGFTLFWIDPLLNYFQQVITYNGYLWNLGVWAHQVPGWVTPNGHLQAEALVWNGPTYLYIVFGWAVVTSAFMRKVKERCPQTTTAGLIAWAFLMNMVFDLLAEPLFLWLGFWFYPGAIRSLSLFPSTYHQFPLYEVPLMAALFTAFGSLRYFKDDHGRTIAERGIDDLALNPRRQTVLRFLALTGAANLLYLLAFTVPWQFFAFHTDPWPKDILKRSYATNGMCGPGTTFACPGSDIPVPERGTSRVGPKGELVPAGTPRCVPGASVPAPGCEGTKPPQR